MYKTVNPMIYVQLIVFFFWLYPSFGNEGYIHGGESHLFVVIIMIHINLYHYFVYFLYVSLLSFIFYFWKLCYVVPFYLFLNVRK